jgi:hypothetical protein
MSDPLLVVNRIRNVRHSELNLLVRKVIVILSSPRSGSSLVKNILASHPDIASLDGEIEPFLVLTKNGFGYDSGSDAICAISNQRELVDNIFDDLSLPTKEHPPLEYMRMRWAKRLLLQYAALFSQQSAYENLIRTLDEALTEDNIFRLEDEQKLQKFILSRIFHDEPWRINYYDGHADANVNHHFSEPIKIEEPPFVIPRNFRRPFRKEDAESKVLLFKAPPDAYRIGMYERLFPNAEVKYIHLTRGFAQTVNGLIDGWLSPTGFFSHDLSKMGIPLRIKGYSDSVTFGSRWWKFDLPPNWREFTSASLEDVCLNQWMSTHEAVMASCVPALRIPFETFIKDPSSTIERILKYFDLRSVKLNNATLPVTMATEAPQLNRWKKREHQLLALGKRAKIKEMMNSLDYDMNPESWT